MFENIRLSSPLYSFAGEGPGVRANESMMKLK
jgi:hypothetical protein